MSKEQWNTDEQAPQWGVWGTRKAQEEIDQNMLYEILK